MNFYQITWYGDGNTLNFPSNVTRQMLIDGSIFESFYPITQLGIQAVPGTRLFLNDSRYPVIVGPAGLWEIDISAGTPIRRIAFDPSSLALNDTAESSLGLIIDMMYAGEGL